MIDLLALCFSIQRFQKSLYAPWGQWAKQDMWVHLNYYYYYYYY